MFYVLVYNKSSWKMIRLVSGTFRCGCVQLALETICVSVATTGCRLGGSSMNKFE